MEPLTQYGRMARAHWRAHLPRMVAELERQGQLEAMLLEAEEKTKDDLQSLIPTLRRQGLSAQQAHDQAWEMVRDRYIFLRPEES